MLDLDPDSFWHKTPREIRLITEGKSEGLRFRAEAAHNQTAWLAWHIAAMSRAKKLPSLTKLLAKPTQRQRQTWQQQMHVMDMWAAVTRRIYQRTSAKGS